MKKPTEIKVVTALLGSKLTVMLWAIVMYYLVRNIPETERSILSGIRNGIVNSFDLRSGNTEYELGVLMGTLAIPVFLVVLILVFVANRKFYPAIITAFLELLVGFSQGFPLLSILIFITLLSTSSRSYLKHTRLEK